MRTYKHLTRTKRLQLEALLSVKTPIKEIAEQLGVHSSTIYRERKRGEYKHRKMRRDPYFGDKIYSYETRYSCDIAHEKYLENLRAKGAELKLNKDYELAEYIEKRIVDDKLTPLSVIGEIKKNAMPFKTTICVNTLYNYIEKGVFLRLEMKHLPTKSKERKRTNRTLHIKRTPRGTSIERRPLEILSRNSFGHWEMDCVCGSSKHALLVLTERLTRKEIIMQMKNKETESVVRSLNSLEHKYGSLFKKIFKSITVDNGAEFSDFTGMEKSCFGKGTKKRTKLYYCHPYCSCERGTNERINREIRRWIPKGSNLANYTKEQIQWIEDWINDYPRWVLGYMTSKELFEQQLSLIT